MSVTTRALYSLGEAARELGEPMHRIDYLVRVGAVVPTFRVGGRRLFTDDDLARLREALARRPAPAATHEAHP